MIIPVSVMIDKHVVINLAGIHQNIVVYNRHPTWDSLVNVMNVGDSYVVDVVVVVRDVRDVGDARVADVHRLEVASADAIVGNVRFAVAKREPAYACTKTSGDTASTFWAHKRARLCVPLTRITMLPASCTSVAINMVKIAPISPNRGIKR